MTRVGITQFPPRTVPERTFRATHLIEQGYIHCFVVTLNFQRDLSSRISPRGLADAFFSGLVFFPEKGLLKAVNVMTKATQKFWNGSKAGEISDSEEERNESKEVQVIKRGKSYGKGVIKVDENENEFMMKINDGLRTWLAVHRPSLDEDDGDSGTANIKLSMCLVISVHQKRSSSVSYF